MAFTPFGFGVRKCPGYRFVIKEKIKFLKVFMTRFADMEMAIVAVEIFSRFSLQPTEDEEEVTPVYGFVTKPNKEIFVNVNTI